MKMIDPRELADYLRDEVHVKKAADLVERFALTNAEDVIRIGDPLPEGTHIEIYKKDDGSQWMRIRKNGGKS